MTIDRPSEEQYFATYGREIGFDDSDDNLRRLYNLNLRNVQSQLVPMMGDLSDILKTLEDTYLDGKKGLLFFGSNVADLQLQLKPFESVKNKVYRVNCLYNRNFPDPPDGGRIGYTKLFCHTKINDLLRTRITCKYMDGPEFVIAKLKEYFDYYNIRFKSYPMNNENGYHAWHLYFMFQADISLSGQVSSVGVWVEIQITTQLAESISTLTHGLYARTRSDVVRQTQKDWRWKPHTQEFRSAYLGHTLHLLEGIIQIFRDEVLGTTTPDSSMRPSQAMPESTVLPPVSIASAYEMGAAPKEEDPKP